jgi:phage tail protein X
MNVSPITYYSANAEFVDMMIHANSWSPSFWPPPPKGAVVTFPLTANGYPSAPPTYPGGPANVGAACLVSPSGYQAGICNFYGEGDFTLNLTGQFTMIPGTLSKVNNITRCQFQMQPPPTSYPSTYVSSILRLNNINPTGKNPPNNFHLICPGYKPYPESNPIFTPEFLAMEAPFSIYRGSADESSNGSMALGETDWNTRIDPNYFGCWGNSFEATIALCNATNSDFWHCVPINATENWMQGFAKLVHDNLNSNLHVYVEVSDECWNYAYPQWGIIEAADKANPGLDNIGAWYRHGEETAFKLMQMRQVMAPILGSQGRFVLMGQIGCMPWTCQAGLNWINEHYGPPSSCIYGIGCAPYIVPSSSVPYTETIGSTTSFFASMNAYLTGTIVPALQQCRTLANEYGVKMVCYEGGQGVTPQADMSDFNFLTSVQTDPAMATLYANLGAALNSTGVDEMLFTDDCSGWGGFGFWGNVVDVRQANSSSPKFSTCVALAKAGAQSPARTPPPKPAKHHG